MLLLNTRSTSSILHRGDGHLGEDGLERANVVELDVRRGAEMREVRQAGLSISDQNSTNSMPIFFESVLNRSVINVWRRILYNSLYIYMYIILEVHVHLPAHDGGKLGGADLAVVVAQLPVERQHLHVALRQVHPRVLQVVPHARTHARTHAHTHARTHRCTRESCKL